MRDKLGRYQASWKAAHVSRLEELWRSGLSAAKIGKQLKRSRNSVIGKLDRLGLHENMRTIHPLCSGWAVRGVAFKEQKRGGEK